MIVVCFGPGPVFKGGIANYNTSLAKAFDKRTDCEVHIVSWTQQYPAIITNVRGLGFMLGIEFVPNLANLPGDAAKPQSIRLTNLLHAAGLMVIPAGANVLRLLPALNMRQTEAQEGLDILAGVVAKLSP